jgi:hypothetical protein
LTLRDAELSFDGPAPREVLDAWEARLERMKALRYFCDESFEHVRTQFLGALAHPEHRSSAVVHAWIARKRD